MPAIRSKKGLGTVEIFIIIAIIIALVILFRKPIINLVTWLMSMILKA